MLNGRQFVANVKITGQDGTEEYPNFVMFSEPNNPDIIPTNNFIQLQDLQGGEIVGLETLMGDLVVFMTNGIFRLSVPSNNPASWSLVEAHPNIGCLHDKVIAKAPNGIFFASDKDIIYLDSGFSATPISGPIRSTYQSQVVAEPTTLRLTHDIEHNRLRLLYDNDVEFSDPDATGDDTVFYMFDIERGVWTNEMHFSAMYDEIAKDDKNNTLLIQSDSLSAIRKAENTSSYLDDGSTSVQVRARTGFQEISSYDNNGRVRRVNTQTIAATTGADMGVRYNSSDTDSYNIGNHLNGLQSTRPYTGTRGKTVEVRISDNNNQAVKIEKIEVDFE